MEKISSIIKTFSSLTLGVVGDVMVDRYIHGEVEKISQEAPTPVIRILREEYIPGGAANTAHNIVSLGAAVFLFGIIGKDALGSALKKQLQEMDVGTGGIVTDSKKPTTEKTRIIARSQQVTRVDKEDRAYCGGETESALRQKFQEHAGAFDAVIVSDYAKGCITRSFARDIVTLTQKEGIPLIVDTKPKHFEWFCGATLIKPNRKESEEFLGRRLITHDDILSAGKAIQKKLKSPILITQGADGMILFEGRASSHLPCLTRDIFDVTGAGDTVASVVALSIAGGANLRDASRIASAAAGIVVGKQGTSVVSYGELSEFLQKYNAK